MVFASYGRKSVFSDNSDSLKNQHRMNEDYIHFHFGQKVESILFYEDEGMTGANANRPDLHRLMHDIRSGMIHVLVVYQLDRLSRDVRDFSNIYAFLEEYHVQFVSVKENIDTTTPIGKAMMYVSVVFAQMERETIAARISDNMIGLAKKGFWTGGNPPYGYVRQSIVVDGKKHVTIVPDPEGVEYNTWIFDTFLNSTHSLQSMETSFKKAGIRTRTGAFFSTTQLHKILTMPYCVEATQDVYDFFKAKGCQMSPESPRSQWNGTKGVMVYGRTTEAGKKHQLNPPEKWLVCLGLHQPFIPAEKWLAVQKRFANNKFDKTMKYDVPLLKGVLRCSCGTLMSVSRKKKVDGSVSSWYYCIKRSRQGVSVCNNVQTKIDYLDHEILSIFKAIEHDPSMIYQYAENKEEGVEVPDIKQISSKISICEGKIQRLTASLAAADGSTASKYIIAEIERMDLELQALKREHHLATAESQRRSLCVKSTKEKAQEIVQFIQHLESFNATERNAIVKDIVEECIWDGKELYVKL